MTFADVRAEGRAFTRAIWIIACGIFVLAAGQSLVALAVGNRQLLKDGLDWGYDVLLYGLVALVFGRDERLEKASALAIAAIMAAAGAHTLYDLWDKIERPRPIEPLALGFSAVSAVAVAFAIIFLLWRFRGSANPLIAATWLSSRNDVAKTTLYAVLGFAVRVTPQRWPEYALDLFVTFLLFQATWRIVVQSLRERRQAAAPAQ